MTDAQNIAVEAVARALAQADGITICSDATYAMSSYGIRARAAIAAMPAATEQEGWSVADARADMLRTAEELRQGGSCSEIEQAIRWEERAASLPAPNTEPAGGWQQEQVERVKAILRGVADSARDGWTNAGMEDAFFCWPVIERALLAALTQPRGVA